MINEVQPEVKLFSLIGFQLAQGRIGVDSTAKPGGVVSCFAALKKTAWPQKRWLPETEKQISAEEDPTFRRRRGRILGILSSFLVLKTRHLTHFS